MIVRNEVKTIRRAIESVRPFIDSWVICDTGSSDGTMDEISSSLTGLPGRLIQRPWVNFGHNRTELVSLARDDPSTYLLLLDADMTVEVERRSVFDRLTADAYLVPVRSEMTYWMPYVVSRSVPWRYEGVTHEYITTDGSFRTERLSGVSFRHHADGGSRADQLERDNRWLCDELNRDPDNPRTVFYLAQTLQFMGDERKSRPLYLRRAEMTTDDEEAWCAAHRAALLRSTTDWEGAVSELVAAWERRPTRAEPLFDLASGFRQRGNYGAAYKYAERGLEIPEPHDDILNVATWVYQWGLRFERSIAAYWLGRIDEALRDSERLAALDLPEPWKTHVQENLTFCRAAR
jgi:glycosyltransferase involved in cell wall biosynthesis